jgi:hypothetical protein
MPLCLSTMTGSVHSVLLVHPETQLVHPEMDYRAHPQTGGHPSLTHSAPSLELFKVSTTTSESLDFSLNYYKHGTIEVKFHRLFSKHRCTRVKIQGGVG